jgi:hypothetical protein
MRNFLERLTYILSFFQARESFAYAERLKGMVPLKPRRSKVMLSGQFWRTTTINHDQPWHGMNIPYLLSRIAD